MAQHSVDLLARSIHRAVYFHDDESSGETGGDVCTGEATTPLSTTQAAAAAGVGRFAEVREVASFADMTFGDQIRLFHRTDVAVMPRGASSANAVFLQPGSLLLEIMAPCRKDDWQVWRLAQDRDVLYIDHAGGTIKADGTPCDGSEEDENADFMMRDDAATRFVVRLAGCRGGRHPWKHGNATHSLHSSTDDSDSDSDSSREAAMEAFSCAALC